MVRAWSRAPRSGRRSDRCGSHRYWRSWRRPCPWLARARGRSAHRLQVPSAARDEARTAPRWPVWYESASMWQPPERIKHELMAAAWPTAEQAASARLFQPMALGARTARQRTWVPAMVPWRATDDGFVTRDVIDW